MLGTLGTPAFARVIKFTVIKTAVIGTETLAGTDCLSSQKLLYDKKITKIEGITKANMKKALFLFIS